MRRKLPGLVVASQKGDSVRVLDFKAKEIFKGLNRVVTSINKIADENVACFVNLSA